MTDLRLYEFNKAVARGINGAEQYSQLELNELKKQVKVFILSRE